jgi:hypothetical protein
MQRKDDDLFNALNIDAFKVFGENVDGIAAHAQKKIDLLEALLRVLDKSFQVFNFGLSLVQVILAKTIIPPAHLKNKTKARKYLVAQLKECSDALKAMQDGSFKKIADSIGDTRTLFLAGDTSTSVKEIFSNHGVRYQDLANMASKKKLDLKEHYKTEINARKSLARLQGRILDNMSNSTGSIEDIIKNSLRDNLKVMIKLKALISATINNLFSDYFGDQPHHNEGILRQSFYYPPARKIVSILSHLPVEAWLTIFILDEGEDQFLIFKNLTPDLRVEISNALPELSKDKMTALTALITNARKLIIEVTEQGYSAMQELIEVVQGHQLQAQFLIWKQELHACLYAEIHKLPQFSADIYFRLLVKNEEKYQARKMENPDYSVGADYDTYMNSVMSELTAADHHALLMFHGVTDHPHEIGEGKDEDGRYPITMLGLFNATKDADFYWVRLLLRNKALQNKSINDFCDSRQRNSFIVALQSGRLDIIQLFINHPHIDFERVRDISSYAHLLDEPPIQFMLRERSGPVARISLPSPQPSTASLVVEDIKTPHEKFTDFLTAFRLKTPSIALHAVHEKIQQLEAAEEKVNADIHEVLRVDESAYQELKAKEEKWLASAKQALENKATKNDTFKHLKKDLKSIHTRMEHIEVHLVKLAEGLGSQVSEWDTKAEAVPISADIASADISPENDFKDAPARAVMTVTPSVSVTFFYNPAASQKPSHQATKAAMLEDVALLKQFTAQIFQAEAEPSVKVSATLLSLQINAVLFKLMQFLEKISSLRIVAESDKIVKHAKLLRNALVHSKGLLDENLLASESPEHTGELQALHAQTMSLANCLISSYETKSYRELLSHDFFLRLVEKGRILAAQLAKGELEEVTDEDRFFYSQRLGELRLRYAVVALPDEPKFVAARDSALNMLLTKLQIYGWYYFPKKVAATVKAERHFEPSRRLG